MSFLKNIFKKKKTERLEKQPVKVKPKSLKTQKKAIQKIDSLKAKKEAVPKEKEKKKKTRKDSSKAMNVLLAPQITEKAAWLEEKNFYVFKVKNEAVKNEIKKAVEEMYNVKVVRVNIIKVPKKAKRLQKSKGFKKGYKKAVVKLEQGQSIEILPR